MVGHEPRSGRRPEQLDGAHGVLERRRHVADARVERRQQALAAREQVLVVLLGRPLVDLAGDAAGAGGVALAPDDVGVHEPRAVHEVELAEGVGALGQLERGPGGGGGVVVRHELELVEGARDRLAFQVSLRPRGGLRDVPHAPTIGSRWLRPEHLRVVARVQVSRSTVETPHMPLRTPTARPTSRPVTAVHPSHPPPAAPPWRSRPSPGASRRWPSPRRRPGPCGGRGPLGLTVRTALATSYQPTAADRRIATMLDPPRDLRLFGRYFSGTVVDVGSGASSGLGTAPPVACRRRPPSSSPPPTR